MQAAGHSDPIPIERRGNLSRFGLQAAFTTKAGVPEVRSDSGVQPIEFRSAQLTNTQHAGKSELNAGTPQVPHGSPQETKSANLPTRPTSSDRFDVYERVLVYCGLGLVALGLFYIGVDFKKSPLERTTSARVAMVALEFMEFAVGTAMLLGGCAFSAKRGQKSHVVDRAAILFGFVVIAIALFL